ncbi:MAG: glycosyltransferase family 4 protein [Candidatus Omnitrophica bacterium]|nr:glycosyltransferase family 4 protein [Candidatus Omnitrophota bacterium]
MKINVICHYYPPEIGAPQARLSEMASEWVKQGHNVTVLTGLPNHPTGIIPHEYRGKIFMEETRDGVRIWRHWLYATPNEGILKKTLAHISFMVSLICLSLFRGKRPDVIIVSSPNFFSVISTYILSGVRRVPYIFEVRDLWPGIFIDLGVLKNKYLIKILESVELFLYRKSAAVVPVTNEFARDIERRGISSDKIEVITNGADLDTCRLSPINTLLRSQLGIPEDNFVISYTGAHGISHGLRKVLEAAEYLKDEKDISFVFVGEGAVKKELVKTAEKKGLKNVIFLPGRKREEAVELYRVADVCLVPLRDVPGFNAFIPSKMFEIMACGKPIIASLKGESADILERSEAALVIPPEDPEELVKAVRILKGDPARCAQMGEKGRRFAEEHYDRKKLAGRYLELMGKVVGAR